MPAMRLPLRSPWFWPGFPGPKSPKKTQNGNKRNPKTEKTDMTGNKRNGSSRPQPPQKKTQSGPAQNPQQKNGLRNPNEVFSDWQSVLTSGDGADVSYSALAAYTAKVQAFCSNKEWKAPRGKENPLRREKRCNLDLQCPRSPTLLSHQNHSQSCGDIAYPVLGFF